MNEMLWGSAIDVRLETIRRKNCAGGQHEPDDRETSAQTDILADPSAVTMPIGDLKVCSSEIE